MTLRGKAVATVAGAATVTAVVVTAALASYTGQGGWPLLVAAAVAGGLTSLPLAALSGRLLTRRLTALSRIAGRIAGGELDLAVTTVPGGAGQDELTEVLRALDALAARARGSANAEQRFTADVAHELRTPLTGLVTAAELLPPGRPTELVRDRVQKLRILVEDLLEVSRLDSRVETADLKPCSLAHVVRHIVANAMPGARLDVVADAKVLTDSRRLDRILTNLLINADRHGEPPVVVTVRGPVVTVADQGAGFPADLLAHGSRRFLTARRERGQGHGLGLTIVQGQAAVIGIELHLANDPHGGAVADLDLTARRMP